MTSARPERRVDAKLEPKLARVARASVSDGGDPLGCKGPTVATAMIRRMTPEEFRKFGHEVVDRIAIYRATLETRAVRHLEGQLAELERYARTYPAEGVTLYSRLASDGITALGRARLECLRSVQARLFDK